MGVTVAAAIAGVNGRDARPSVCVYPVPMGAGVANRPQFVHYSFMRMLVSLGVGLVGTVALFGLKDFLMACETCVQPDGGLGITMLTLGALLVPAGFALRKRRRSSRPDLEA